MEFDQARSRHHRRHGARSRGADGNAAALPAQRRQGRHEFRPRQCRGRARRLQYQCEDVRPGEGDGQSDHHREAGGEAADLDVAGARRRWRGDCQSRRRHQGAERADAGAALCARRQGGDAGAGAALDPDIGKRREPDADVGHVLRPGVRHRQRVAVGRPLHRTRCGDHFEGAGSLSVRLFRADHQPRDAAALCQRPRGRRASGDGYGGRPAHQGRDRTVVGPPRLERLVRPVVGRRRRFLARCLRHGLPDPRPRKGFCGAGRAVQERARPHP